MMSAVPGLARAADDPPTENPDYTLRIATGLVELSPQHIVSTTLYNGQFPGPLVRLTEGKRVVVDVYNDTDTPELVHWHGQMIPSGVDGASEEGTPFIPAKGMRRITFVPIVSRPRARSRRRRSQQRPCRRRRLTCRH
jgi:FtsP/CotA-like multicopper oxidase with cupredoxin domain